MSYLEELTLNGAYDELKKYLSGFLKPNDEIFLRIGYVKYLEAQNRNDDSIACEILQTEMLPFKDTNKKFYQKIEKSFLLNRRPQKLGDIKLVRATFYADIERHIKANPMFSEKLVFPPLNSSGLRALVLKHVGPGVAEIKESTQCRSFRLPDSFTANKIKRLVYNNSGNALIALTSNAVHKLWRWNESEKTSASISPDLWNPASNFPMNNEVNVHSVAISDDDSYAISAFGGKIALLSMKAFKPMTTSMAPQEKPTILAFNPQNVNTIAIGMDDSTIHMYHLVTGEHIRTLTGHNKMITGLAFSRKLNLLISSSADSQFCAWGLDDWKMERSSTLQSADAAVSSETTVHFHKDQLHFLIVHSTKLAVYDGRNFVCLKQWVPPHDGTITCANYSCDGRRIYTSLTDGSVNVFNSNLSLRCQIHPSAYLDTITSLQVHALVVAAHPFEANQFALGLTDGSVQILEPLESQGRWGAMQPAEMEYRLG